MWLSPSSSNTVLSQEDRAWGLALAGHRRLTTNHGTHHYRLHIYEEKTSHKASLGWAQIWHILMTQRCGITCPLPPTAPILFMWNKEVTPLLTYWYPKKPDVFLIDRGSELRALSMSQLSVTSKKSLLSTGRCESTNTDLGGQRRVIVSRLDTKPSIKQCGTKE